MILIGLSSELFSFFNLMCRNGKICKREVKKMMKDMNALSKLGFKTKYGDGATNELIGDLDQNDDGEISLGEFLEIVGE